MMHSGRGGGVPFDSIRAQAERAKKAADEARQKAEEAKKRKGKTSCATCAHADDDELA
jgi:hypothetical protein